MPGAGQSGPHGDHGSAAQSANERQRAGLCHEASGSSDLPEILAALRHIGIVVARREGNSIFYRVANPKLMQVCDLMREVLEEQIASKSRLVEDLSE